MTKAPKFRDFITEKVERSDIQVAVLTKVNADSKSVVSNMILKECERRNIPCHIINTSEAWVSKNDLEKGTLLVSNIDGEDTEVEFELSKQFALFVLVFLKMKLVLHYYQHLKTLVRL